MAKNNIKNYCVGKLKIAIDRSKCLSCGTCSMVAPKTFVLDEELISKVKEKGPYDREEKIKQAVKGCSVQAITIEKLPPED